MQSGGQDNGQYREAIPDAVAQTRGHDVPDSRAAAQPRQEVKVCLVMGVADYAVWRVARSVFGGSKPRYRVSRHSTRHAPRVASSQ